ncbi:hypothetical protein TNCV_3062421 [Trichonephila clavipes]|nr:hypothetical protein TNCV_3062421 [Trichonephila clavipes]
MIQESGKVIMLRVIKITKDTAAWTAPSPVLESLSPAAVSAFPVLHLLPSVDTFSSEKVQSSSVGRIRHAFDTDASISDFKDAPRTGRPVIIDESRFNLSSDDNSVREWRPRAKRLNIAFAVQRLTA